MSAHNPRTGPETARALQAAFPECVVNIEGRAAFGHGTLIHIRDPDSGVYARIASRERIWVQALGWANNYSSVRAEWQGAAGWQRLCVDLRAAMVETVRQMAITATATP